MTINFSSCPNDTFIFDALINKKIQSDIPFDVRIADIEVLNKLALENVADITKISCRLYPEIKEHYEILDSGAAIVWNTGPLIISKKPLDLSKPEKLRIAVPGLKTTANFLLKYAIPEVREVVPILFSDIEAAILEGRVDAGVIIHESRFTYQQKGLMQILDLGEFWCRVTGEPLPLGCIVIKRNLGEDIIVKINKLIKESIIFAKNNPSSSYDFVKKNAFELEDEIIKLHIALYVNDYSVDMGKKGRSSILRMEKEMYNMNKLNLQ